MTFWKSDAPELIGSCYRLGGNFVQLNAQPQLRATIKSCKSLVQKSCMLLSHISNNTDKKKPARPAPDHTPENKKSCMLLVQKLYVSGAKAVCYWCKSCMSLVQKKFFSPK